MELNYNIIAAVILVLLILLWLFLKRNNKDKKALEHRLNNSNTKMNKPGEGDIETD